MLLLYIVVGLLLLFVLWLLEKLPELHSFSKFTDFFTRVFVLKVLVWKGFGTHLAFLHHEFCPQDDPSAAGRYETHDFVLGW